jgi:hypothetical protein
LLCLTSYHHFASTKHLFKRTSLLADIAGNWAFECCRLYCRDLDIKHDCHKSSNQTLTINDKCLCSTRSFRSIGYSYENALWISFHSISFFVYDSSYGEAVVKIAFQMVTPDWTDWIIRWTLSLTNLQTWLLLNLISFAWTIAALRQWKTWYILAHSFDELVLHLIL